MVSFSIVFIWLFMRHLTRPLLAFTSHVQRIGRGAEHTLEPIIISRRDEVGTLAEAFNAMLGEIAKQRTAVQDQLHFLQLLIDSMPTPIFYKDYEGRYLGCNRAFSDVLGFRREELIGKTVFDIAPTDLAQIYQRADLELLNHGGTQVYEASLAAPDGSRHEVVYYKATFQRSPGVMGGLVGTIIDITARKQAEAALAEEKEFSERLLQNAALPCFVIDHQHRVMSWNAACEKLTGLKSEDMVGSTDQWRAFYDSPRPLLADLVLDGLPERVKEYYQISGDSILTPGGMQAEGWLRLSNAQERYLFFNAAPIRNSAGELVAVIETLQDLTERKKGEDGAREMLSLLSATLEATADGILVVDGHGHVVTCNQNFSRLWRIPPQLLERQADDEPLLAYVASQMKEPEEFVARVNEIYGQPEVESHDIIHCSDGRVFERHSRPQRVDDVIVGRVWSFRDMSEQHRLEGQLRHAQKMEAIGTLSGGIAHDFNNILTAIIGYSGLLERKLRHDDQLRHYVQQIQTVSERACGLTQSLLAYSRKQITHLVPLDLNLCIGRVGRMLERLIGEDLELLLTLYPEELKITADSLQIEQVLMNLVTNARDAMPGGGVISIETELVNLDDRFIVSHGYGSGGKYAMLSISDTGSGMDEETVKRVFEPFFTTKEVGKGTGLGLSIVYGIIKKHNGFITCYSEVGKGSTFRIYIPSTDSSPLEERAVAPSLAEGIHGHEMILLAEDNSATRLLTRDILEEVGFKVLLAADGEEALSLFHQHQQEIDLVVLDVIMPKRKGKEVYDIIMESSASPPVLFISGYTADVIHRQGFLDTTLNFLAKPFTPSALLQKVREVLET
jgi:PAS domain S-box-containing protein